MLIKTLYFFSVFSLDVIFCQVVNVAVNQTAYQYKTVEWANFWWTADKAVDNCTLTNDTEVQQCCSSTATTLEDRENNFWRVDFSRSYEVQKIKLHARTDTDVNQVHGFDLYIIQNSEENLYAKNVINEENGIYSVDMMENLTGVVIRRPNDLHGTITICELQVFAGCDPGWYGYSCFQRCGNCSNNEPCNTTNGYCYAGCQAGWKGEQCKTRCQAGEWGENCKENCSYCINETACDMYDGSCPYGCAEGWTGATCDTECDGTWGMDCLQPCGNCFESGPCNHINGTCWGRCDSGWQGDLCLTACHNGTWGYRCNSTCGNCLNDASCDNVNGQCPSGCAVGWQGLRCTEEVQTTVSKTPDIATLIGGVAGTFVAVLIAIAALILWKRRRNSTRKQSNEDGYINPTASLESPSVEDISHLDKPTYNNFEKRVQEFTIALSDLREFCRSKCVANSSLFDEFDTFPHGLQYSARVATTETNKKKNRYKDMFAYDKTRVKLPQGVDGWSSDYINASFIQGYTKGKFYIAAQGVMENTRKDFWWMIWTQDIYNIVMLTKCHEAGRLKCFQYWPADGEDSYGHLSVTVKREEIYADFILRKLLCTNVTTKECRSITQFHFTSWPDKDVPDYPLSLVQFWRVVATSTNADKTPWLIHCSAGVGRTGTFIALDYLYQQARAEQTISVNDCVKRLREQRVNMVQTATQYIFLHQAVLEAVQPIGSVCKLESFLEIFKDLRKPSNRSITNLEAEFELIQQDTEQHMANDLYMRANANGDYHNLKAEKYKDSNLSENKDKTRDPNVLADDRYRPHLMTVADCQNDYINAVWIQTYLRRSGIVVTQTPLANTVIDFLRLVWDTHATTVIIMDSGKLTDNVGTYWESKSVGPFRIEMISEETRTDFTIRQINIMLLGEQRRITQFQYNDWPEGEKIPNGTLSFLQLLDVVYKEQEVSGPIIIHCLNGADRCGLFCVIWTVMERLKVEKNVAIAETVRTIRIRRAQIIPNKYQYQFCFDVINDHLKNFELYANIL